MDFLGWYFVPSVVSPCLSTTSPQSNKGKSCRCPLLSQPRPLKSAWANSCSGFQTPYGISNRVKQGKNPPWACRG